MMAWAAHVKLNLDCVDWSFTAPYVQIVETVRHSVEKLKLQAQMSKDLARLLTTLVW